MTGSILPISITFIIYALIILLIAYLAKLKTNDLSDYVLAGRSLSGSVTALGAGASDMSSWLLMALPGAVYINGLNMIWMPVALVIGAYCNWIFIAKRLRIYTELAGDAITIPEYFNNRFKDHNKILRLVTSFAIIIFFTCYSVSGFVSGAVLTSMIFKIDYLLALLISAGVIVAYTAIGGFLAVNWIDFFQGILMFFALLIVPIVGFIHFGGITSALKITNHLNPNFLNIFHNINFLSIISLLAWGLGYFGQPHINVRFMAIRSVKELPLARRICMNWMILSLIGAVLTGLIGFIYYKDAPLLKEETVFIMLSYALFNPWLVGILLSAILSAIMSTVSSLILITASVLAEDFYHVFFRKKASAKEYLWAGRGALILVAAVAIIISMHPEITILRSVAFAWSGLGASFGPVMIFSLYWRRMNRVGAICGVLVGAVTVILWKIFDHSNLIAGFEILPGFIFSAITIVITSIITKRPADEILKEFDLAIAQLKV